MNKVNNIDSVIAAAEQQAAKAPAPEANQALQTIDTQRNAVGVYTPAVAPSLDALAQGSMNVDGWLKVKEFGLLVDSKPNLIETIKVKIDLGANEIQAFNGLRFGNPPTYFKTYDGNTCATGGTWQEAVRKANSVDPSARPYLGADIQMTLLEDAKDAKGATVAEAGVRLGHSTSITNRNAVAELVKAYKEAGLEGQVIEVEIGYKKSTNAKGQSWGLLTFKLLGAHGAGE